MVIYRLGDISAGRAQNMKLSIRARSSGDAPYQVDFLVEDNKLSVHCNCRAGIFGKLCKHKTELLAGDASRLFDESEAPKLVKLAILVARAPELGNIPKAIAEAEKIIRREQAKVKTIKKDFGEKLKRGVEIVGS